VGPVKATFSGEVNITDVNAPESYRISGQGQGGFAGFSSGGATVKLTEISANETQMDYDVDAQIGGKLAMLGSRLIDSTAQSLAGQFFDKFAQMMKAAGASAKPAKIAVRAKAVKVPAKKAKPKAKAAIKAKTKVKATPKPAKKTPAKKIKKR
jgi:hypothetical protein